MPPPPDPATDAGVEAIRHDLACPACGYNLRGLHGDTVRCPECGLMCDVAKLVTAKWDKPWFKAPGLNRLVVPVAVVTLGSPAMVVLTVYLVGNQIQNAGHYISAGGLLLLGGWLWALFATRHHFDAAMEGIGLALLGHIIFVAHIFALITLVGGVIASISLTATVLSTGGVGGLGVVPLLLAGLNVVIGAVLFWAGRRGEKFMAARCIRQYLREQSRGQAA